MPLAGGMCTGSGKDLIAEGLGLATVNEIVAHATAAWTLHPDVRSVIEIGGQDSKFIRIGRDADGSPFIEDSAFNDLCAAGTGAFLDQMAERLGLDIETFGRLGGGAARPARMAGRCTVFAKTDMIHLQQRACPTDEIVAGLCFALARTYLANLCHGRRPEPLVVVQGGVADNDGVVRAFREILGLGGDQVARAARPRVMGALGAALLGTAVGASLGELARRAHGLQADSGPASGLGPLVRGAAEEARSGDRALQGNGVAQSVGFQTPGVLIGIDVGSVSTKVAIIDRDAHLVASSYLPTAGRPVDAVRASLQQALSLMPPNTPVLRVVSTGSGRLVARDVVGADEAVDEISAQARSAAHFCPAADTVFEIGGQDAKYIRVDQGRVTSFQMNRACAAGTGAFLEEQAGRLGLSIRDDFAARAFASTHPAQLGSRCTVFMDSDLVHHLQHGAEVGNLCAGLAYAVARNYLEKVVGSHPVGQSVVFQGGVARNEAVVAALRANVKGRLAVHPHPEVSGALGAALIARDAFAAGAEPTRFRSDAGLFSEVSIRTFECRACENLCEVQRMDLGQGRVSHFGSVCGRFERADEATTPPADAFVHRERLLQAANQPPAEPRGTVGIPMALTLHDYLPFWRIFFQSLGFAVTLSNKSDRETVQTGTARVPVEFCQPLKVLFGHVHRLLEQGITTLFIPHLRMFEPPGEKESRYACPYTQAAPYVVREHLAAAGWPDAHLLTLEYPVAGEEDHWLAEAARILGRPVSEIRAAFVAASQAQTAFREGCVAAGRLLLAGLDQTGRRGAVLLGRPYNTADRYVNLNLVRRLQAAGFEPIPFDFLPLASEPLPPYWARVRWGFGREQLQAARILRQDPRLVAVVVTNFGCGPDAFVDQYLEHELADTPHLLLEFDDHQAEAGLVTRIEAFARTCRDTPPNMRPDRAIGPSVGTPDRPLREFTYYIPFFSDHARAFTGALRSAGCRAVLLPPTTDASWQLGLRHAYGRECHPYVSFLGDLLMAAGRPDFVAAQAAYYGPSYFGPCLVPQYMVAMRLVLDRVGLQDVRLINVADPPTMASLGRGYIVRLGLGIYAIDRLYKWKVEVEPYEMNPGQIAATHEQNMEAIEQGLHHHRFLAAVRESVTRMAAVPLRTDVALRPRIGIVGDAYTRVNEHANAGLYRRLQDMGFEVWTSCSLIDISMMGAEQLPDEMARKGRKVAAAGGRLLIPPAVAGMRHLVDRLFPDTIRTPQERTFREVRVVADRYASHWIDKALSLNLNRVEEFCEAGAHGVINAMCHNCMLGTVTAALTDAMRRDLGQLPMCSLIYDGLQSTHHVNRLEAFAHQVRQREEGKRSR